MMPAAFVLTILFVWAFLVWTNANHRISRIGLPDGRVVYQDVERRHTLARPLVSLRHGLTGKPDYLVETNDGLVPVELKSRECPRSGPYAGEAAQLTAYCVLVEDTTGVAPAHGIVQYADRPWQIPYNRDSREQVVQILGQIRDARTTQSVHRNHTQPARCRNCGFRSICDEQIE
jgi:CRISPR-associated exonuclease Cas4